MTTLEELEKRIAAQEDLRAIERLQANYWDYLDAKNWEGLRSILVEDFVFINNTTGGRYEGREGMLSTRPMPFPTGRSKTTCTTRSMAASSSGARTTTIST